MYTCIGKLFMYMMIQIYTTGGLSTSTTAESANTRNASMMRSSMITSNINNNSTQDINIGVEHRQNANIDLDSNASDTDMNKESSEVSYTIVTVYIYDVVQVGKY
jgi:hypothetical protein